MCALKLCVCVCVFARLTYHMDIRTSLAYFSTYVPSIQSDPLTFAYEFRPCMLGDPVPEKQLVSED